VIFIPKIVSQICAINSINAGAEKKAWGAARIECSEKKLNNEVINSHSTHYFMVFL
jgi:hypothetical protein